MHRKPEEFLGVDVGDKRIGIARGSEAARIAEPLKTFDAGEAIDQIKERISQNQTDGIVVGLPRSLDGNETAQSETVRQWVKRAKADISLPFYWQDEALTSQIAERQTNNPAGADAVAASIILQDFLDTPQEQRVRC